MAAAARRFGSAVPEIRNFRLQIADCRLQIMTIRLKQLGVVLVLSLVATGCAAGKAFRQGEVAARAGNLDEAVAAYRRAVLAAPTNPDYRIALERASLAASRAHLEKARDFE